MIKVNWPLCSNFVTRCRPVKQQKSQPRWRSVLFFKEIIQIALDQLYNPANLGVTNESLGMIRCENIDQVLTKNPLKLKVEGEKVKYRNKSCSICDQLFILLIRIYFRFQIRFVGLNTLIISYLIVCTCLTFVKLL